MRNAADVLPTLPEWLWLDRCPRGGITLIVGTGGVGKSTLAVELAARLSRGELTGQSEPALLALQEDDQAAVTVPRLIVAEADRSRVDLDGDPGWRFPRDLDRLDAYARDKRPALVVIDPLDASVPSLASQSARGILDDLHELASRHAFALLALHHLTKSGRTVDQRIGGGRAVQAVARSILVLEELDSIGRLLVADEGTADLLCLHHHKSNYGKRAESLLFERAVAPHPIAGGGTVARLLDAGELPERLESIVSSERGRGWRRRIARALIERFLLRAPCPAEDLASDVMVVEEVSQETFERARAELANEGIIERFQQDGRHWWRLCVPDHLPEGVT